MQGLLSNSFVLALPGERTSVLSVLAVSKLSSIIIQVAVPGPA